MMAYDGRFVLDRCLGAMETVHPLAVPPGYVTSAINVELSATEFLRPRAGSTILSMTSGPTAEITYLFSDQANAILWAFVSATGTGYRWNGSAWSTVSLTDFTDAATPHAVAYNGKVFLAYNGTNNRLHVYSEGVVRRVGIGAVGAGSAANGGGAGAYAATIRYYKIQMRIHEAADASKARLASSELSAAISFTPSGANANVTVTKPTTVDSATHWAVYCSADGITYYDVSGSLAVATTTYADTINPSQYSDAAYDVAREAGFFVPPPSAKFLATNGERLFMAGAYESTASSGETTPTARRVWFTRPLGVTDEGDDEAITSTGDNRYWVDIDNDDGGVITGLASSLDGSVYAFTATSVWRLVDTGNTDVPIRAERVVNGAGALSQYLVTSTDVSNASAIYFMAKDGPYRYSPNEGAVWLGADWVDATTATSSNANPQYFSCCHYDPIWRRVVFASANRTYGRIYSPALSSSSTGQTRGGWGAIQFEYGLNGGANSIKSMAVYGGKLHHGGQRHNGSVALGAIFYIDTSVTTDNGTTFISTLTTPDLVADVGRNMTVEEMLVIKPRAVALTITGTVAYGTSLQDVFSDTLPAVSAESPSTGAGHRAKVEGSVASDVVAISFSISVTTPTTYATNRADAVPRVEIPYRLQEAA